VLALKATGNTNHPRVREAIQLLTDRLLPDGGCNYGNTAVLGQVLLPHIQPTGLVMCALGAESGEWRVESQEGRAAGVEGREPEGQGAGKESLARSPQPTAHSPLIERSLEYLERTLGLNTPAASLAYGVMGLSAHGRRPADADSWLESAWRRELSGPRSPYKLALLAASAFDCLSFGVQGVPT
jgi:hypothetical protein